MSEINEQTPSPEFAAYSYLEGHVVVLETTDANMAATVAGRLTVELSLPGNDRQHSQKYLGVEYFASRIDDKFDRDVNATRPHGGDFAVAASAASRYEIDALPKDSSPAYIVAADTRNSAREVASVKGVVTLQDAFVEVTKDLFN